MCYEVFFSEVSCGIWKSIKNSFGTKKKDRKNYTRRDGIDILTCDDENLERFVVVRENDIANDRKCSLSRWETVVDRWFLCHQNFLFLCQIDPNFIEKQLNHFDFTSIRSFHLFMFKNETLKRYKREREIFDRFRLCRFFMVSILSFYSECNVLVICKPLKNYWISSHHHHCWLNIRIYTKNFQRQTIGSFIFRHRILLVQFYLMMSMSIIKVREQVV